MSDRQIEFADYQPQEVPDKLPATFWAYWDIGGEFMEATEDAAKGMAWIGSSVGYVAKYARVATNQEDWKP